MGRKKINISEIENSRQRTVTFGRRRAGLIKKAHQLSILCNLKVALVIFDTKNASHVYSSSGVPDEMFSRYLNKQFMTDESRRRNDNETNDYGEGGTYGFDNNGSFIRRRLAVVNNYKVTSDGDNPQNLHIEHTKQYHTPCENKTSKCLSTASTSSTDTLDHGSQFLLSSPLLAQASFNEVAAGMPPSSAWLAGDGFPARSASLGEQGPDMMVAPVDPSFADLNTYSQGNHSEHVTTPYHYNAVTDGTGGIIPGLGQSMEMMTTAAENINPATQDLSSLSLFSDAGMHTVGSDEYMKELDADQKMPLDIDNVNSMLDIIRANIHCDNGSSTSISGSSNYSNDNTTGMADINQLKHEHIESETKEEPEAKRPRLHSFTGSNDAIEFLSSFSTDDSSSMQARHPDVPLPDKCEIDQGLNMSLVEGLLSNSDVTNVLKLSSWGDDYMDNNTRAQGYSGILFENPADKEDMFAGLCGNYSDADSEYDDDDDGGYTEYEDDNNNDQQDYSEDGEFLHDYSQCHSVANDKGDNQMFNLQTLGQNQQSIDLKTTPNMMHSLQSLDIMQMETQLIANGASQQAFYNQAIGATGMTKSIFNPVNTTVSMAAPDQSYGLNAVPDLHYSNNLQATLADCSQISVVTNSAQQQCNFHPDILLSAHNGRIF
ncbi:hypothetical protein H4S08_003514 [Coemansia sp. RSA 1365]|nr:hypothetical protein H4S08_003514 [Coemansia sp. RSA 1365]